MPEPPELRELPELREPPEELLLLGVDRELRLTLRVLVVRDGLLDEVSLLLSGFLVSFELDFLPLLLRSFPVLLLLRSTLPLLFFAERSTFRSLLR